MFLARDLSNRAFLGLIDEWLSHHLLLQAPSRLMNPTRKKATTKLSTCPKIDIDYGMKVTTPPPRPPCFHRPCGVLYHITIRLETPDHLPYLQREPVKISSHSSRNPHLTSKAGCDTAGRSTFAQPSKDHPSLSHTLSTQCSRLRRGTRSSTVYL